MENQSSCFRFHRFLNLNPTQILRYQRSGKLMIGYVFSYVFWRNDVILFIVGTKFISFRNSSHSHWSRSSARWRSWLWEVWGTSVLWIATNAPPSFLDWCGPDWLVTLFSHPSGLMSVPLPSAHLWIFGAQGVPSTGLPFTYTRAHRRARLRTTATSKSSSASRTFADILPHGEERSSPTHCCMLLFPFLPLFPFFFRFFFAFLNAVLVVCFHVVAPSSIFITITVITHICELFMLFLRVVRK